jgi:putative PIN family toxin of toxin-antitoxin system
MKNKLRVVIDTNVFMKAWFEDVEVYLKLMELIDSRKLVLLFSQDTIGELMYMIKQYSIIKINKDIIRVQLMHELADLFFYGISVNTSETTCPNINDSNDEMFLKCATEGKAEFLISAFFNIGKHI